PHFSEEGERLVTLASYTVSELYGDEELARLAQFAAHLCETPTGAVSLVEAERQIFLASEGVAVSETPRSTSFCATAMLTGEVMVVPDATKDPRFADYASVTSERHLRFYAGAPLISSEGAPLGALCVTDIVPRPEGL
ncbi:MAG: GAF domain-containing protein, partial [Pseudomonadota bacterium]